MSLVTTASTWINDDAPKKRAPTMRKTIKNKSNVNSLESYDNSQSTEGFQNSNIDNTTNYMQDRNTRVNDLIEKITSVDNDSEGKMGDFKPLPNPNMSVKKDMDDNTDMAQVIYKPPSFSYSANLHKESAPSHYLANETPGVVYSNYRQSYETPMKFVPNQPYYAKMGVGNKGDDKLMEKINYMIHLLEEQQHEKTSNITEEFILYTFLGVFIIFVCDSFARSGKYIR